VAHTEVTFAYNRPGYQDIYLTGTPVYDTIFEQLCILAWSYDIVVSTASQSD
jgi:hypothetical protein